MHYQNWLSIKLFLKKIEIFKFTYFDQQNEFQYIYNLENVFNWSLYSVRLFNPKKLKEDLNQLKGDLGFGR